MFMESCVSSNPALTVPEVVSDVSRELSKRSDVIEAVAAGHDVFFLTALDDAFDAVSRSRRRRAAERLLCTRRDTGTDSSTEREVCELLRLLIACLPVIGRPDPAVGGHEGPVEKLIETISRLPRWYLPVGGEELRLRKGVLAILRELLTLEQKQTGTNTEHPQSVQECAKLLRLAGLQRAYSVLMGLLMKFHKAKEKPLTDPHLPARIVSAKRDFLSTPEGQQAVAFWTQVAASETDNGHQESKPQLVPFFAFPSGHGEVWGMPEPPSGLTQLQQDWEEVAPLIRRALQLCPPHLLSGSVEKLWSLLQSAVARNGSRASNDCLPNSAVWVQFCPMTLAEEAPLCPPSPLPPERGGGGLSLLWEREREAVNETDGDFTCIETSMPVPFPAASFQSVGTLETPPDPQSVGIVQSELPSLKLKRRSPLKLLECVDLDWEGEEGTHADHAEGAGGRKGEKGLSLETGGSTERESCAASLIEGPSRVPELFSASASMSHGVGSWGDTLHGCGYGGDCMKQVSLLHGPSTCSGGSSPLSAMTPSGIVGGPLMAFQEGGWGHGLAQQPAPPSAAESVSAPSVDVGEASCLRLWLSGGDSGEKEEEAEFKMEEKQKERESSETVGAMSGAAGMQGERGEEKEERNGVDKVPPSSYQQTDGVPPHVQWDTNHSRWLLKLPVECLIERGEGGKRRSGFVGKRLSDWTAVGGEGKLQQFCLAFPSRPSLRKTLQESAGDGVSASESSPSFSASACVSRESALGADFASAMALAASHLSSHESRPLYSRCVRTVEEIPQPVANPFLTATQCALSPEFEENLQVLKGLLHKYSLEWRVGGCVSLGWNEISLCWEARVLIIPKKSPERDTHSVRRRPVTVARGDEGNLWEWRREVSYPHDPQTLAPSLASMIAWLRPQCEKLVATHE
uniref:Uncharacterized protein n=1 Tax=Chromera velia CCMP2878 TaxID=1169474 RepID=A0A0G4HRX2_9ALVE|eukprot:Cvel_30812.t1-p1 / transcript=Cvel_30812.t1 / gene=Cvel_30812 / organism=Chromera_velia_CCMP2878 / gene_product=hypothetical protein / transcript_product=hypothetical protein / location=Cvel_scaffold4467:2876-7817(-) / protein_length=913 / sequence_SO=supercontig / SO=protein_coding / is_pseudo=false